MPPKRNKKTMSIKERKEHEKKHHEKRKVLIKKQRAEYFKRLDAEKAAAAEREEKVRKQEEKQRIREVKQRESEEKQRQREKPAPNVQAYEPEPEESVKVLPVKTHKKEDWSKEKKRIQALQSAERSLDRMGISIPLSPQRDPKTGETMGSHQNDGNRGTMQIGKPLLDDDEDVMSVKALMDMEFAHLETETDRPSLKKKYKKTKKKKSKKKTKKKKSKKRKSKKK